MRARRFHELARAAMRAGPRKTLAVGYAAARRRLHEWQERRAAIESSTYSDRRIGPLVPLLPRRAPLPWNPELQRLCSGYLRHEFDILGSGWTRVEHGMACAGLEGHLFPPQEAPVIDRRGRWLEGRINDANLAESRRIWHLVDPDYRPLDWHLDFKSGYRWKESTPHMDVPFGHLPGVDIKVPWELARMQHLPQLALLHGGLPAGDAGRVRLRREFRNEILDFVATNPPRFGVNWRTTMDVGIRVANWLVAYDLFRAAGGSFDAAFDELLRRSVYEHAHFIINHLEYFPHLRSNHYLANICGLGFAAAYLPRSGECDAWLAFALQELVTETLSQFNEDGSNFEASTCYHRLSGEMVAWTTALLLGLPDSKRAALEHYDPRLHLVSPPLAPSVFRRQDGQMFSAAYVQRLTNMARFTTDATKPDGHVAQFGDNDSGRFLRPFPVGSLRTPEQAQARYDNLEAWVPPPDLRDYWDEDGLDHRGLVAVINALVPGEGGFEGTADHPDAALVRLLANGRTLSPAPSAAQESRTRRPLPVPPRWAREVRMEIPNLEPAALGFRGYPDFGLYIWRSGEFFAAIRCGAVGQRGNGGHAHADQLCLEVQSEGRDLLRDPGTYVYTPLPKRRNEYRSNAAHAAVALVGVAGAKLDALFSLPDSFNARVEHAGSNGFVGHHSGFGPSVYRRVSFEPNCLVVQDWCDDASRELAPFYPHQPAFSPGYGQRLRQTAGPTT